MFVSTQAFAEAAKQSTEIFQKDEAPFVVKNRLGLAVSVLYSEMFSPLDRQGDNRTVELQNGERLNMDYSKTSTESDQFSAIISLSEKGYYIQPSKLQWHTHCRDHAHMLIHTRTHTHTLPAGSGNIVQSVHNVHLV